MTNRPALAPAVVAAILLLIALAPLPLGYYTFMRWAVTVAAIAMCALAHKGNQGGWLFLLIPIAILFNPISPVYMTRAYWAPFDVIAAAALLLAGARITKRSEERADQLPPRGS